MDDLSGSRLFISVVYLCNHLKAEFAVTTATVRHWLHKYIPLILYISYICAIKVAYSAPRPPWFYVHLRTQECNGECTTSVSISRQYSSNDIYRSVYVHFLGYKYARSRFGSQQISRGCNQPLIAILDDTSEPSK